MKRKDILSAIVKTWGVDDQVFQSVEEMAELTKALSKMRRQKYQWGTDKLNVARDNVIEEIADVELMLEQIKSMFELKPLAISRVKRKKLKIVVDKLKALGVTI